MLGSPNPTNGRLARLAALATVVAAVASCSGSSAERAHADVAGAASTAATASGATSPSTTPTSTPSTELTSHARSERVRFHSAAGELLVGQLFGDAGSRGVILAHQIDDDQSDWFAFAPVLAARGYTVLTFNFQGTCGGGGCSKGGAPTTERWMDVVGAIRFLERRGVDRIALVGASLGGEASIAASARLGDRISALVTLSASMGLGEPGPGAARRDVAAITVPKLFLAGEGDVAFADAARVYARVAPDPVSLGLLPTGEHGVDLLRWDTAERTQALVTSFLDAALRT